MLAQQQKPGTQQRGTRVAFVVRYLAVPLGLALLVLGGVVHGLWTDRWKPSVELEEASRRLADLPANIGSWKGQVSEQDPDELRLSGAAAHYSRTFTDPVTGDQVLVILLAGKPARMAVHRPEHCYQAAGYALSGPALRCTVTPPREAKAELWTGLFVRNEPTGPSQLRTFWTWYAGDRWEAPDSPRWRFARQRILYKLYVIRNVMGSTPLEADPCVRLLGELLPILNRALSAG
jgi:hypothetical protein